MGSPSNERQIQLALQAMHTDQNLSIRQAAKIYNVPRSTLTFRVRGRVARVDTTPKSRNLDSLEEDIIVREILDRDLRGFPPRYCDVEDMANRLRTARIASRVGKRWASNFVKRQPQLRTRFTRPCDYQRALCEDPKVTENWFRLVRNTITKYGITGFLMGQITSTLVVTSSDGHGKSKALQPGGR